MNRIGLKQVALLAMLSCVMAVAFLLSTLNRGTSLNRGTWIARFSYFVAPGEGRTPFLNGNRELADRFCSADVWHGVVAQCLERYASDMDEAGLMGVVTGATIRVSREKGGVVCDFALTADSRHLAENVAKCYLAEMHKVIDIDNRKLAKKVTLEMSASLRTHEKLKREALEKYEDVKRTGIGDVAECKIVAERVTRECAALHRELSEAELAASKRGQCIVLVRPLSAEEVK